MGGRIGENFWWWTLVELYNAKQVTVSRLQCLGPITKITKRLIIQGCSGLRSLNPTNYNSPSYLFVNGPQITIAVHAAERGGDATYLGNNRYLSRYIFYLTGITIQVYVPFSAIGVYVGSLVP